MTNILMRNGTAAFGVLSSAATGAAVAGDGDEAHIHVRADEVKNSLTRYMTGACIEDVNHEIYGGIYSQMIFGESFQEPSAAVPPRGFEAFGSWWNTRDGVLHVDSGQGAPLFVAEDTCFADGEAGVEVFFDDERGGNASMIIHTREARKGIAAFVGYDISLDPRRNTLIVARRRQKLMQSHSVDVEVPAGRWIALVARIKGTELQVDVGGKTVFTWQDDEDPLPAGSVGLQTWKRTAQFRNFWVRSDGARRSIPFEAGAEVDDVSCTWCPVRLGAATGRFSLETDQPCIGRQSQRITLTDGEGAIGIENRSLNRWGMCFRAGKPYEGYLWLRAEAASELVVALQSEDGATTYAEDALDVPAGDWCRLDFTLTPDASDSKGRFAILLKKPGSVLIGHAFLQPGAWGRFKDLPLRKDIVEGLIDQGLTVLRYGGSMVNAPEYRWKKMIGSRDRRLSYDGTWYPYSTNGWGIIDFIGLCEAAGFLSIPAFNMDETPQDMADFIEYVNGPADSDWGSIRVHDGHPDPYNLEYVQLGNEEAIDEDYWRRFKPQAEAIWAKDPDVIIILGDFVYRKPFTDPYNFEGSPRVTSLAVHKKILDFAAQHDREVWIDVHIGTDEPRQPHGLGGVPSFIQALARLCPDARFKVPIFELNAGNHALRRALSNAHAINEFERIGDMVPIVCSANCLQPYGQNDNGWDQGLLFFNPSQVWGQPPYYVTQMISRNYLPLRIAADVDSPDNALDVTAKKSDDGKILQLQVVNVESKPMRTLISIEGFSPTEAVAQVIELSAGELDDINTPEAPERIVPGNSEWAHEITQGKATYTFPPDCFTILRFA